MSEIDRESISALLDNEADDLELRRFLKASEQDPSLLETWERFSLVQSVLHESAQPVSADLSQRIATQLEQEAPLQVVAHSTGQPSWKNGLGKIAIAASVAAVFLVSFQINLDGGPAAPAVSTVAEQSTEAGQSTEIVTPVSSELPVALLADSPNAERVLPNGGILNEYIQSLTLDAKAPVLNEQIQDSPLYRLVNTLQPRQ